MKSRRRMLRDRITALEEDLAETRLDRTAVHEKLAGMTRERDNAISARDVALLDRRAAEDEKIAAVAHRDTALQERAEAMEQNTATVARVAEVCGQRDAWAEKAEQTAMERNEAQVERDAAKSIATAASARADAAELAAQQWEDQHAEASRQVALRIEERDNYIALAEENAQARLAAEGGNEALAAENASLTEDARVLSLRLIDIRQQLDDCRASRSIVQAQRDDVFRTLTGEPGVAEPLHERAGYVAGQPYVNLKDGRSVPLKACAQMGEHIGHAWWPRADLPQGTQRLFWCDGRNPDGTEPYDPARAAVMTMREDAEALYDDQEDAVHDDHPGPAGAERLRFEDAAFDAMRDALLALNSPEPYDPDEVSDKLRRALGMLDTSGSHVRPDAVTWEMIDEAQVRAIVREELAARFDTFTTLKSEPLEARAGWPTATQRMADAALDLDADDPRVLIEHWQGVAKRLEGKREEALGACAVLRRTLASERESFDSLERDYHQVKSERDELRPLAALADPITAQMKIAEAETRMNRAEAEFANLTVERDAAISQRDEAQSWIAAVNEALGDHRTTHPFVDDAVREVVRKLHAAIQRENDRVPPLSAVFVGEKMDEAVEALAGSLGIDFRLSDETPHDILSLARTEVERLGAKLTEERERVASLEAMLAGSTVEQSMLLDGAMENALGKLVGVLGVEAYESPADVIETALEALKDARREAGRLRMVLDIIDERKGDAGEVEHERRRATEMFTRDAYSRLAAERGVKIDGA